MACLRQGNDGEEVLNGLVCKTRDRHNQQHGGLNWLVFEAPKDETSEPVRQALEGLLFVVTGALVSNPTEAEQEINHLIERLSS